MVSQQFSMPTSLRNSRGSLTSLNTLTLDLPPNEFTVGRSLSMIDMKHETMSLCSVAETDEDEGVNAML